MWKSEERKPRSEKRALDNEGQGSSSADLGALEGVLALEEAQVCIFIFVDDCHCSIVVHIRSNR